MANHDDDLENPPFIIGTPWMLEWNSPSFILSAPWTLDTDSPCIPFYLISGEPSMQRYQKCCKCGEWYLKAIYCKDPSEITIHDTVVHDQKATVTV